MGSILKSVVILSALAGFGAGFLILIPFLAPLAAITLFLAMGAGIIVFLKKKDLVGFLTVQDGCLMGGIAGAVSLVAASVVYLPIWYIINLLFSKHYHNFGLGNPFTDFAIILMFVIFVALLSAVFNAFSGMVAAYIYEKIEERPFELPHFEIEQDDKII